MMDVIFNLFKIRFNIMDELFSANDINLTRSDKVNIFINLESVLRKLHRSNLEVYLKVKKDEKIFEFVSNILNLAAHYRLYFSKQKIYSKVYIYLGYPFKSKYKNNNFNEEYRKYYQERFSKNTKNVSFSNLFEDVMGISKTILEYIEGVYIINSNSIEPSVIPYILMKDKDDNFKNFIVTTDRYEYQYVDKDFYILRPKKELSYIITKDNVINQMKIEEKINSDLSVDSSYISFILSILGNKYRNIKHIKRIGLSTLIKLIRTAIDNNILGERTNNIYLLSKIIKDEYKEIFLNNYYCTDLDYQIKYLNIVDIHSITDQIKDKFDNASLNKLNNDYFNTYPIMLLELTSAVNLIKKKKDIFLGR